MHRTLLRGLCKNYVNDLIDNVCDTFRTTGGGNVPIDHPFEFALVYLTIMQVFIDVQVLCKQIKKQVIFMFTF